MTPSITASIHDRCTLDLIVHEFPPELTIGREGEAVAWVSDVTREELKNSELAENISSILHLGRYAVVTGLEMPATVPPTPEIYLPSENALIYDFDIPQLAISSLVGACYATEHLRGSRILADIFPKDTYGAKADSAFGSNQPFDFHGDGAIHPDTKPEYFSLRAVRNIEQVPTTISWVEPGDLSEEDLERLQEPVFTLHYESTDPEAHSIESVPVIESGTECFLRYNYFGRSKISLPRDAFEHARALATFEAVLKKNSRPLMLAAGEVMILDNKAALHAREAFQPVTTQSQRRWMRRSYIAVDERKQAVIERTSSRILRSSVDRGWYL